MQIGTNIAAFNTWRNYTSNVSNLRESMSKLSSGSRINDAGDDPSGLAMSERLRTQSRNTAAAAGNVENRLNQLQTTDSWMQKIHDMLGRMGELAVMANDGTKSQTDRDVLQNEFAQMQEEIVRITTGTSAAGKFNGTALFQGGSTVLQVGADGGQTFTGTSIDLQETSQITLADGTASGGTANGTWAALVGNGSDAANTDSISALADAATAVTNVNDGIDYVSELRSEVGAEMKRMEQTLDGLRSYEENISATQSRIRDVDVAKETAEMSKYNILQQVGTAMMAQANQIPQGVLQLVG